MGASIAVVTGAGGFLGRALSFRLLALGFEVRGIARGTYPDLERAGVKMFQSDLADPRCSFRHALVGAQVVFHVAAKVDMWGPYEQFYKSNVIATQLIIRLCREEGVTSLVFTSSPSVVANGKDLRGIDEQYPYPKRFEAYYPQTKALAEQEVLRANEDQLHTIALRPHLIWGPGDTNLVPTILERARAGRLVQIGNGANRVDVSYIEDCVEAHILAMRALEKKRSARGRAFFISQGEPVLLWPWINQVLERHGLPPIKRRLPRSMGIVMARVAETFCTMVPGKREPPFTRFLVSEMATDHFFNIAAAKRELDYVPQYTVAAAMEKTFATTHHHE